MMFLDSVVEDLHFIRTKSYLKSLEKEFQKHAMIKEMQVMKNNKSNTRSYEILTVQILIQKKTN